MNGALKLLVDAGLAGSGPIRWEDLLDAVEAVFAGPFDWEAERVMLSVLRFDGRLRLSELSELPHSMSPEDMLKSFAIQWLARETGLTHLLEMQRVEATAVSPVLAAIVRATIRGAIPLKSPMCDFGVVAEVRPSRQHDLVMGPLGRGIGQRPPKGLIEGMPTTKAVTLEHSTRYDVVRTRPMSKNIVNKAVILEHDRTFLSGRRMRKNMGRGREEGRLGPQRRAYA